MNIFDKLKLSKIELDRFPVERELGIISFNYLMEADPMLAMLVNTVMVQYNLNRTFTILPIYTKDTFEFLSWSILYNNMVILSRPSLSEIKKGLKRFMVAEKGDQEYNEFLSLMH